MHYLQKHERHFAAPKRRPKWRPFPAIPEHALPYIAGQLGHAERKALRNIAETADLLFVEGQPYLLAMVTEATLAALAAFEAEAEDRENDLCDEPGQDEEDADPQEVADPSEDDDPKEDEHDREQANCAD